LKHCAANRKRRISALPNVGPYIYDVNISGFTRSSIYVVCLKSSVNGTRKQTKQAFEDGPDRGFRNVGQYKTDAGETPKS
jgi:hypothetical protein